MDRWTLSGIWLLLIKLLRASVPESLCTHVVSFFLGKYLGVELLGQRVGLCLVFLRNYQTFSHSDCTSLYSHQQHMRILVIPQITHQHLVLSVFYFSGLGSYVSACGFNLHFFGGLTILKTFSCAFLDIHVFFCEFYSDLLPVF